MLNSKSWSSLPERKNLLESFPSLQKECLVRTREENPETLRKRQAAVKDCSVAELAQITSLTDIPIPTTIENLFHPSRRTKSGDRSRLDLLLRN